MIEEGLDEIKDEQDKPTIEDVIDSRAYPTQVMVCKQSQFRRLDLDCLFFAFYY